MNTSSFLTMNKQIEQAIRAMRPSCLDTFEQMERGLEPFRQRHLAIAEQIQKSSAFARMQEIAQANQRMLSAFDKIKIDTRGIEQLANVHATWTRDIQASIDRLSHVQASAKLVLTSSSQLTTIAEQLSAKINFDRIRDAFKVQEDLVARLKTPFDSLSSRFVKLSHAADSMLQLAALPAFVLPSASRELVTASHAVVELWPDPGTESDEEQSSVLADIQEEISGIHELLSRIDPALAKSYQGARDALASGSIDRDRHVLASLRELWGHLLRTLAPDDRLASWLSDKSKELIHEGKPTRRARVLYICRYVNHEPLTDFLDTDTKALIEYVQFLNRVHQLDTGLSDRQLNALLLRTDSWLTFMVQISQEGYEC